jgi:hypothetical protein
MLIFTPDTEDGTVSEPIRVFVRGIRAVTTDGKYMIDVASIGPEMVKYLAHEHELANDPRDSLNDLMTIGHVVEVRPSGLVLDGPDDVWAPEVHNDDETEAPQGWEYLGHYSSQDHYRGPHMHDSECIGERLEDDIRETPGVYVAVEVTDLSVEDEDEDNHAGWVVLRKL